MMELRAIPGLPGYWAATDGGIWSNYPWKSHPKPLRLLKPKLDKDGYPGVALMRLGRATSYAVHRLVALTFHGPCPDGMQVCHLNHVKTDTRPENLCYGTPAENTAQTRAAGGGLRGQVRKKLTPEQVLEIRGRLAHGETPGVLAKTYQVSYDHVLKIRHRRSWRHLTLAPDSAPVAQER